MIGFTLCSPGYWHHTQKAVETFQAATGLSCIVGVTPQTGNYLAKFQCPVKDQTVVYFDSDTRWIRKVDLSPYDDRKEFFAVRDCENHRLNHHNCPDTFSHHDIKLLKLDPDKYFNAGMFIYNPRRIAQPRAMRKAKLAFGKLGPVKDFGDQIYLNWSIQKHEVPFEFLPVNFNTVIGGSMGTDFNAVCLDPYMIHAAGVPISEKTDLLDYAVYKYREAGIAEIY